MQYPRHDIRFPVTGLATVAQGDASFTMTELNRKRRIRLHDYAAFHDRPGLYEQLFYERLKCNSPARLTALLHESIREAGGDPTPMRAIDVGTGNDMIGELRMQRGAARAVGIDIIEAATRATERGRPGTYLAYHVSA